VVELHAVKNTSVACLLAKTKMRVQKNFTGQAKSMCLYFGERRKIGGENHTGNESSFQFNARIIIMLTATQIKNCVIGKLFYRNNMSAF